MIRSYILIYLPSPFWYVFYREASRRAIPSMAPVQLSHSPAPMPLASGNRPPSTSPNPRHLLTASLMPTVPHFSIKPSAQLT